MADWDEELGKQFVAKGVKIAGLTAKELAIGVALLMKRMLEKEHVGLVKLSKIQKDGGKLVSTELKGADLLDLERVAKRYGVATAATLNANGRDYTLFFKSSGEHQMQAALKSYLAMQMNKEITKQTKDMRKESLQEKLERAKVKAYERSAAREQKVLDRERGRSR